MKSWLVDTGPIVAYLDADDPAHREVAQCWNGFRGHFVTTGAVITEAMHFLGQAPDGARQLAELVSASSMEVFDLCHAPELRAAAALMGRYADTPMDFADATLLLLAEALDVHEVLTLDRRGFSTFRTRKRRALKLVLNC